MKHARLELARSADILPALDGKIAVFGQLDPERLRGLDFTTLNGVSESYLTSKNLERAGISTARHVTSPTEHALVCLPRAKAEAWHLIGLAIQSAPHGWIVVDGQKTDGVDSIAKHVARNVTGVETYSKGHGKTIWFRAEDAQSLRTLATATTNKDGFLTMPGVFSSDAIDPASAFLIETIPDDLNGELADFGAGWGFLSERVLRQNTKIRTLHLVEDNAAALDCARENISDPRAEFHWADALSWKTPKLLDAIIMNPPFHTGRSADPSLGINFIHAAARALKPGGMLYMVANAHLPYEPALEQSFDDATVLARSNTFKVFCAKRGRKKRA